MLGRSRNWGGYYDSNYADCCFLLQRQATVSQFFQIDRLVVEGGKSVCITLSRSTSRIMLIRLQGKQKGNKGDLTRESETG